MPFIPRLVTPLLKRAAKAFPALVLTGPRRAGKTTVLKHAFPGADVVALDAPDILAAVRADPRRFLQLPNRCAGVSPRTMRHREAPQPAPAR
jgi:hypothetical protein